MEHVRMFLLWKKRVNFEVRINHKGKSKCQGLDWPIPIAERVSKRDVGRKWFHFETTQVVLDSSSWKKIETVTYFMSEI